MELEINDHKIAYEYTRGRGDCVIFCPGFNSTMQGNKALALESYCREIGSPFIRFDYLGHGDSSGDFADGCISNWLNDTLTIIDNIATNQIILVGSSMGGWIALLAALKRRERIRGLLLIACAADMTKFYPSRVAGLPREFDEQGRAYYLVENRYDDHQPYSIYQKLIDDGASHYLLDAPIDLDVPVTLMHGMKDDVVEWQRSSQVKSRLTSNNVNLCLSKTGDHRLSTEHDLLCIRSALSELLR